MIKDKFLDAYKLIKEAEKILLVTHDRPDGDALSSTCAVIEILKNLDKDFGAYCMSEVPFQFNFLPHVEYISADRERLDFDSYDLIIALDCGQLRRTNLTEEIKNRRKNQKVIEFDHHPKIDSYADIEVRLPKSAATTEVLYDFVKHNKIKITKNLATCILAGIITDTGNLLYESTSEHTIKISSEMIAHGARFPTILEKTWRNKSLAAMRLWGQAMNNLQINLKYNFAFSVLQLSDMEMSGATEEELEGIAGFLSNLHGVKAVVLLREIEDNKIKGSIRGMKPGVDISELARKLGGGGHKKASGFIVDGHIIKKNDKWVIE